MDVDGDDDEGSSPARPCCNNCPCARCAMHYSNNYLRHCHSMRENEENVR
jgi:hypothetical protein